MCVTTIVTTKHLLGVGGLAALPGVLFAALTADAILPLFSLAGGAAVAVVYLFNAPRDADQKRQMAFVVGQLQYANQRVTDLEKELSEADDFNRQLRRRLAQCYDEMTRAGIVIHTPDPDREPPRPPPQTPV